MELKCRNINMIGLLFVILPLACHRIAAAAGNDRFVVKISDAVKADNCTQTLSKLEDLLINLSELLHNSSVALSINQVDVMLPESWKLSGCQPSDRQAAIAEQLSVNPDLLLTSVGELKLQSLQPRGCGSPGLGVILPMNLLTDSNYLLSASDLMDQVIRSRFGVFDDYSASDNEHNRYLLSKQNLLCEGNSLSEVVPMEDLKSNYSQPVIRYMVEARPRITLVLEQTSRMANSSRWKYIKRSLYRFINLLEENTVLSIITFGREGTVALPPTVVTSGNREGLHGRIPRRVEEGEFKPCLDCGLNLALGDMSEMPGTIVIITGGGCGNESASCRSTEVNSRPDVKMMAILYPEKNVKDDLTEYLPDCLTYNVRETNTELGPLSQLNEILLDVLHRSSAEQTAAMVHMSEHLSYEFSGTFIVEQSLRKDVTVTLSIDDEQKVEFFEVTDPSGEKNIFSKFEDGMVILKFNKKSEAGIWTFHAKLYHEAKLPKERMVVDVVCRGDKASEGIRVSGLEMPTVTALVPEDPVILLVRVEKGEGVPVQGAELRASVRGPDSVTEVVLKDTGTGYPDIEQGDGVYSGYLTRFSTQPGYYSIRLMTTDNNGYSFTQAESAPLPTGSFRRFVFSPSFYVGEGVERGQDIAPPSRITDLQFTNVNSSLLQLELSWSSPGGDYDQGRAARYEIRCHTNPLALTEENFTQQGILVNHSAEDILPLSKGSLQTVEARVPWSNETFYYGVAAFDSAGNRGMVSNLIEVYVEEVIAEPSVEANGANNGTTWQGELKLGSSTWLLDKSKIYIISGSVAGAILIIAIIVISLLIRAKTSRRGKRGHDLEEVKSGLEWGAGAANGQEDTYEAGFGKITRPTEKVETESGIYSWLESLPRSENMDGKEMERQDHNGVVRHNNIHHEEEEEEEASSNSSRPTTSTDDSISEGFGSSSTSRTATDYPSHQHATSYHSSDQLNHLKVQMTPEASEELTQDDYAQQVLSRSLYYYSFREAAAKHKLGIKTQPISIDDMASHQATAEQPRPAASHDDVDSFGSVSMHRPSPPGGSNQHAPAFQHSRPQAYNGQTSLHEKPFPSELARYNNKQQSCRKKRHESVV